MTKIPNLTKVSLRNLSLVSAKISGDNIFSIVFTPVNTISNIRKPAKTKGIVILL